MNFSSLGHKFKLKFDISRNFELTRFYYTAIDFTIILDGQYL
jgi:hypothetical protein